MNFPTPSDSNGDSAATTETETETETVYDGRMDEQEEYWAVIDTERFLQKLCLTNGVAVDDSGKRPYARYTDAEGESPLADHGLFYYRTKKEMGGELADLRSDGDLNDDQNLPNYKHEFGAPEFDHVVVTAENAEDFGLDAEIFGDDEEIFLPTDYEPETDDDGNLVVWYETENDAEYTKDDVLTALNDVKGLGPKKAGKALNALQDAGIVPADLQ